MSTFPVIPMPAEPDPSDPRADLDDTSLVPTGKTARQLVGDHAKLDDASQVSLGSGASAMRNVNQVAQFQCDACKGTGRFVRGFYNPRDYGPCRKCKGTGKLKTDPETLAARRQARKDAKQSRAAEAIGAWMAANKAEADWIVANETRFAFAFNMRDALDKYHSLTPGQLEAVRRCMARDEERARERAAQAAAAPQLAGEGFTRMLAAFVAARVSGLKYIKLRVTGFIFSVAGQHSRYTGQIFVKTDGADTGTSEYCGRIDLDGRWFPSRAGQAYSEAITTLCRDPLGAATTYGKQTGRCSCCGRELENPESVALGIGPICRDKWGL